MAKKKYLTLDLGNTRNKFALFSDSGEILRNGSFVEFSELFSLGDWDSCIYSKVGLGVSNLPLNGVELNSSMELPLNIHIEQQQTLGADRLAAILGAQNRLGVKNCMVIDAGTCVTYDYLLDYREYWGGAISPGLSMRFKMLNLHTASLPDLSSENWEVLELDSFGNNTRNAIFSGVILGMLDEITARINRFNEQYVDTTIVLTGGNAAFLANHIKTRIFVEPLLIHYGLYHAIKSI